MSDHDADLMEIVGTHGWKALVRERDAFLQQFEGRILAPARNEFDFVEKEVAAGVMREMKRFFVGVEQTVDTIAKQKRSS